MGLEPFEVRFFFRQQFTKLDLALKWLIKNCLKLIQRLSMKFFTIWKENFLVVKSLMGTPVDWKIFTRIFFFQLRSRAHGGIQIKICFSTIKDLPIWFFGNKGIFVSQNSYGYTSSFSRFIFRLRDNQSKKCFKLTIYWLAKLKPILENKFDRRLRDNQ